VPSWREHKQDQSLTLSMQQFRVNIVPSRNLDNLYATGVQF